MKNKLLIGSTAILILLLAGTTVTATMTVNGTFTLKIEDDCFCLTLNNEDLQPFAVMLGNLKNNGSTIIAAPNALVINKVITTKEWPKNAITKPDYTAQVEIISTYRTDIQVKLNGISYLLRPGRNTIMTKTGQSRELELRHSEVIVDAVIFSDNCSTFARQPEITGFWVCS